MNTPSQEIYNEIKSIATQIWSSYDDTYGYATEKISYINSIKNIEDNAMVFYRMFDNSNQETFRANASNEVLNYIQNNK